MHIKMLALHENFKLFLFKALVAIIHKIRPS